MPYRTDVLTIRIYVKKASYISKNKTYILQINKYILSGWGNNGYLCISQKQKSVLTTKK